MITEFFSNNTITAPSFFLRFMLTSWSYLLFLNTLIHNSSHFSHWRFTALNFQNTQSDSSLYVLIEKLKDIFSHHSSVRVSESSSFSFSFSSLSLFFLFLSFDVLVSLIVFCFFSSALHFHFFRTQFWVSHCCFLLIIITDFHSFRTVSWCCHWMNDLMLLTWYLLFFFHVCRFIIQTDHSLLDFLIISYSFSQCSFSLWLFWSSSHKYWRSIRSLTFTADLFRCVFFSSLIKSLNFLFRAITQISSRMISHVSKFTSSLLVSELHMRSSVFITAICSWISPSRSDSSLLYWDWKLNISCAEIYSCVQTTHEFMLCTALLTHLSHSNIISDFLCMVIQICFIISWTYLFIKSTDWEWVVSAYICLTLFSFNVCLK